MTVSRKSRDLVISHPRWEILDYVEGHYVQAKRKTGVRNWSILMSIRIDGFGNDQKTTIFAETFGRGPIISSGLNSKMETEIVAALKKSLAEP